MAHIQPLEGKYYGTIVELHDGARIEIWIMDGHGITPSKRQLEKWDMTLEEAKDDDMMCDSHFESARGYGIAEILVDALNTEIPE